MFSPHTRGCSAEALKAQVDYAVFPAYAGMFLQYHLGELQLQVFPAYAGMFLARRSSGVSSHGFPRIRGDVPSTSIRRPPEPWFSPHTRGCSGSFFRLLRRPGVFPAYAGMFRIMSGGRWRCRGFPRIRGDVPTKGELGLNLLPFSPHTRGCSCRGNPQGSARWVFPAYAGMFQRQGLQ